MCHADTLRYNQNAGEDCSSATTPTRCLPDCGASGVLLPSGSREVLLRQRREAEVRRIRDVLSCRPADGGGSSSPRAGDGHTSSESIFDDEGVVASSNDVPNAVSAQRWRAIKDHEARWHFLEETCFFGHNLGIKKINKLYPWGELCQDDSSGFGETKYLRKYIVSTPEKIVTHEADPMFHEPLEKFLQFLCSEEEEWVIVPFYVLPFPEKFMTLSLEDHIKGEMVAFDLEGNPEERRRQRVSDYSIPWGNRFLNDPISYNKTSANVSLPVKLML